MDKDTSCIGVIFKVSNSKYSDKLISIVDSSGKKVALLAKGVRQHSSKRSQSIEVGNLIKVKFVKGYNVGILTDIKVVEDNRDWKSEVENILYLQMLCEVISYFCFEENTEPKLYNLIVETLSAKTTRLKFLVAIFGLKLLDITGNLPELDRDVKTSDELSSKEAVLAMGAIGYTKSLDEPPTENTQKIYKTQRYCLLNNISESLKINLEENEDSQLLQLSLNWIELVIDKQIKSREIIRGMNI